MTNEFATIDDPGNPQHPPVERAAAASRSTWVSVIVNVALSCTQIAIGVLAKSQGLIADGIHSFSDLIADFVVLYASHHGARDPDAARRNVMGRHRVLSLMTHVDPWRRPDLDHASVLVAEKCSGAST